MNDMHHPDDETLLARAGGHLPPGAALVLAVHLEGCAECRRRLRRFEAIGGAMLETGGAAEMTPGSLDRALAVITRTPQGEDAPVREAGKRAALPPELTWPRALRGRTVGAWRWVAPGIWISRVLVPEAGATNVALLRIAPGKKLLEHSHDGMEWTQVLCGSFADCNGVYPAGSFVAANDDIEHQPYVNSRTDCICLIAVNGRLAARGLFGRLMRRYVGL